MPHFKFDNVNDAFEFLVGGIADGTIPTVKSPSRVGDVLQIPEPVIITYRYPLQNVLFNPRRDSNCFFTLYESLWMLAGRNDIAPLNYYSSNYAAQVQDGDNPEANGAYGYRWRNHAARVPLDEEIPMISDGINEHFHGEFGSIAWFDQLGLIVDHLKKNPNSRRVVLQMWTVSDDLLKVDKTKDVACNVCAFFSIRNLQTVEVPDNLSPEEVEEIRDSLPRAYLDMTVINRSNDVIWGMLGANVVHFAFLQEYLACRLGVEVGVYNQFSNNAHVYQERFSPEKWLKKPTTMFDPPDEVTPYDKDGYNRIPILFNAETFDREVEEFVELNKHDGTKLTGYTTWAEPFLKFVAQPMMHAFHMHKSRDYPAALRWMELVQADDWRKAGFEWIMRRKLNWEKKGEKNAEQS